MSRLQTWDRPKDPDEVLDYVFDYEDELDTGDAIDSYTLTVDKGHCAIDTSSNDDTSVTAWFSGGQEWETCEVTSRIVTQMGRTFDRTGRLLIRKR